MKKKQEAGQGQEQQPKKHGVRNGVIIAAVIIILAAIVSNTGNKDETEADTATAEPTVVAETAIDESPKEEAEYTLQFGELLSATESENENGSVLVIKAKIEPNLTNKWTIEQNYNNVYDLIKNQGVTEFDELQYWAVADMTDGTESKAISFTLSSDVMDAVYNDRIASSDIGDYATDLWILPSLLND